MSRYVALLKGINVGRNKQIAMADLRALLVDAGFGDVRTHLRSGNAVFSSSEPDTSAVAADIEQRIADALGMSVACLVRSSDEIDAVVADNPFAGAGHDGSRLMAHFLSAAPHPDRLAAHDPRLLDPGRIELGDRVIYQWCPDGLMAAPPAGTLAERHLGVTATGRNWNTVARLSELLRG
jgi:uncharacterized protein (DUF1697 family)